MFLTDCSLTPLTRPIAGGGTYTIPDLWYTSGDDLVWQDVEFGRITVPQGFITDDASVPKFLDWIPFLDRQGLSRRPGIAHDALYSLGRIKGKDWCDRFLKAACMAEGMKPWQARAYYQGVHLFGDRPWADDAWRGVYGATTSGDFVTPQAYAAFIAGGKSIFKA